MQSCQAFDGRCSKVNAEGKVVTFDLSLILFPTCPFLCQAHRLVLSRLVEVAVEKKEPGTSPLPAQGKEGPEEGRGGTPTSFFFSLKSLLYIRSLPLPTVIQGDGVKEGRGGASHGLAASSSLASCCALVARQPCSTWGVLGSDFDTIGLWGGGRTVSKVWRDDVAMGSPDRIVNRIHTT